MSFTIPSGSTITLVLARTATTDIDGIKVWTLGGSAAGVLTPSPDGLSALYKAGPNGNTDTVTVADYKGHKWKPRKLYISGDKILDASHHTQQVTAGTRTVTSPDSYTSNVTVGEPNTNGYVGVQNATTGKKRDINIYQDYVGSAPAAPSTTGAHVAGGFSSRGAVDPELSTIPVDGRSVAAATPPTFDTGGGTTVDNEITWTDEGVASNASTWNSISIISSNSATILPPTGNYLTLTLV